MGSTRIVLADIHNDIREICKTAFPEPDYELKVVNKVQEALGVVFMSKPDILVIDAALEDSDTPNIVRTLRTNSLTFNIPILVIISEDRHDAKETFNRAGICDFVVKPFTADRIKNEVDSLIQGSTLFGSHINTKIISFCGAKGGAGVTTMAVNSAVALNETGKTVILLELANYFSGIKPALSLNTRKTVPFIMNEHQDSLTQQNIYEFIENHESGIRTIPSISSITDMEMMSAKTVRFMRRNLVPTSDYAIVDGGYGVSDAVLELIDISDQVVFVATLDMLSLYNLELINLILEGTKINREKCGILFNHVHDSGELPENTIRQLELKLPIWGFVPHHAAGFLKAINKGKPYLKEFPKTPSAKAIRNMLAAVEGQIDKQTVEVESGVY